MYYDAKDMAPTQPNSSRERRDTISKRINCLGSNRHSSSVLKGPETKNDYAGEGQFQFTVMLCHVVRFSLLASELRVKMFRAPFCICKCPNLNLDPVAGYPGIFS